MANQQKKLDVQGLIEILEKHHNFALVKYDSTSHKSLEKLRRELKGNDAQLKIVKISLFEKAVNKLSPKQKPLQELSKKLFPIKETSALLTLGEDYLKGLSAFSKFAKTEPTLSFKFGLLDNKVYLSEEVLKISLLPTKEELMAKIIGSLKSGQYRLVSAMKYNVTKLTLVLKERSKQSN